MTYSTREVRKGLLSILHEHLQKYEWSPPLSEKMIFKGKIEAPFKIELDIETFRNNNSVMVSPSFRIKWDRVQQAHKEMNAWEGREGEPSPLLIARGFSHLSTDSIPLNDEHAWENRESYSNIYADTEEEILLAADKILLLYERYGKKFMRTWSNLESAANEFIHNERIWPSWYIIGGFLLTDELHGREAACHWISEQRQIVSNTYWIKQIEFFQETQCVPAV